MKKIFSILAVAVLALCASCDKIDPEDYLIFAGASGQWFEGSGVADQSQRALVEKYTGVRCVNCPDGDAKITAVISKPEYQHRAFAVAIHGAGSTFGTPYSGYEDLRNEDAITWIENLIPNGRNAALPSALIQRNTSDAFNPSADDIEGRLQAVLGAAPVVAIAAKSSLSGRETDIDVDLEFLQDCSDELTLTIFLMEDGIKGKQSGAAEDQLDEEGLYTHNHVLRDVITDVWGLAVPEGNPAGTKRMVRVHYPLEGDHWVAENCKIVAFVSRVSDKGILNVAECEL